MCQNLLRPQHGCGLREGYWAPTHTYTHTHPWHLPAQIDKPVTFPAHTKVFGDNRGVVKGWWKGRSQNRPTNDIFRHIHSIMEADISVHT